jgi:hypothetical protein
MGNKAMQAEDVVFYLPTDGYLDAEFRGFILSALPQFLEYRALVDEQSDE